MTLPTTEIARDPQTRFSQARTGAHPFFAACALTLISAALGLPLLAFLDVAFDASEILQGYALGQVYLSLATPFQALSPAATGPLIAPAGGPSLAGLGVALLAVGLIAGALVHQLRAQIGARLPLRDPIWGPRLVRAFGVTVALLMALGWGWAGGSSPQDAAALGLAISVFVAMWIATALWYQAVVGALVPWRAVIQAALAVAFFATLVTWLIGAAVAAGTQSVASLTAWALGAVVLGHLLMVWLIVVLGVHALAHEVLQRSGWQDLSALARGQQVDFGLAILKTLAQRDPGDAWTPSHTIAAQLGAKPLTTAQALGRLHLAGLVRRGPASADQWRLATPSLDRLTLGDLMDAFDATLDPDDGAYASGPQPALTYLADQERRLFQTNLALLTGENWTPELASSGMTPALIAEGSYTRLAQLVARDGDQPTPQAPSQVSQDFPAFAPPPLRKTASEGGAN